MMKLTGDEVLARSVQGMYSYNGYVALCEQHGLTPEPFAAWGAACDEFDKLASPAKKEETYVEWLRRVDPKGLTAASQEHLERERVLAAIQKSILARLG